MTDRAPLTENEVRYQNAALDAENQRLRKGIQDYLDGNYDHPRAHRHEPAMGCKHGRHYYEPCEECDSAHFAAVLRHGECAPPVKEG